jgi:hypothetical protein
MFLLLKLLCRLLCSEWRNDKTRREDLVEFFYIQCLLFPIHPRYIFAFSTGIVPFGMVSSEVDTLLI